MRHKKYVQRIREEVMNGFKEKAEIYQGTMVLVLHNDIKKIVCEVDCASLHRFLALAYLNEQTVFDACLLEILPSSFYDNEVFDNFFELRSSRRNYICFIDSLLKNSRFQRWKNFKAHTVKRVIDRSVFIFSDLKLVGPKQIRGIDPIIRGYQVDINEYDFYEKTELTTAILRLIERDIKDEQNGTKD